MTPVEKLWIKLRYAYATQLSRPTSDLLDRYFAAFPDVYRMERNGPRRVEVIAEMIAEHVGPCTSILDVACYEGRPIETLLQLTGASRFVCLDISNTVLERARERLGHRGGSFHQFDLARLYEDPSTPLPVDEPCDIVVVGDVLYHVGPHKRVWTDAQRDLPRKAAFFRALQSYARKAVVVQHFPPKFREAIASAVVACGGRRVDDDWGICLLPGTAGAQHP